MDDGTSTTMIKSNHNVIKARKLFSAIITYVSGRERGRDFYLETKLVRMQGNF